MSRYDNLLAEGRALTREARDDYLLKLALSPYFGALIAEIRQEWEGFAKEASQREVVAIKGRIEHCLGSAYGVEKVEGILRKWANIDPKLVKKRKENA